MQSQNESYLTERKAAAWAGVSRTTLRRHRAAGKLRPLVLGFVVLYPATALQEWKARHLTPRGRRRSSIND